MRVRGLPGLLCLALVVSLSAFLWGGVALAGFSDVTGNHWAAMNIEKMNARGVIGGYPDGSFQPNKTVSQVEAVCMAVRALGLQASAPGNLPDITFPVPGWAESDVKLAVRHGLLKSSDQFSAYSGASRAWVARLLVRMIDKESEADERLLMPNFTDTFKIPDWAVYYVRVAQDNDLVAGYADNSFKPDQPVTRAELVAFLSRVEKHQPARELGYISGSVVSVGASQIAITADDGRNLTFTVPAGFSAFEKSKRVPLADLQRFDRVKLLADGSSLKFLEVTTGQDISAVVSGTVKKVYPEANAFVVELPGGGLKTLLLPGNASMTVVGSSAQGLNALQPGDLVEVTLNSAGYVTGIVVNSRAGASGNTGVVYDLDHEEGLLTLQWDNDQLTSYPLAELVSVQSGARFPTLNDIRKGDRVRVTLENGVVTGIELVEAAARLTVQGRVIILDTVREIVNLEVEGKLQVYRLSPGVKVSVPGLTSAFLSDVKYGDTVTAAIKDGQVVSLAVEGRESGDLLTATVLAVDTGNRMLTLKGGDDKLMAYDVKREARIVIDGDESSLGDIERDMEVKIRLLDGDIIYIEVDNTIGGTVVSLDRDGLLLVLEQDSGGRKTYLISSSVDVNSWDGRDELRDIKRGDYAKVVLDNNKVTEINLRNVITYRVTEVRESYNRLNVEDEDGDSTRLYIRDGVELVVPGVSYPGITDVSEGDLVKATFTGRELKKVEVYVPLRGEVTSINVYQGSVNLKLFDGRSKSVSFTSGSKVEAGGRTYDYVSALAVGDRVEVLENADGGSVFTVMKKVSGKLAFDGSRDDDEIYIGEGYLWTTYNVDSNVYVHDSFNTLSGISRLKQGDSVTLYLVRDVVCEVFKR